MNNSVMTFKNKIFYLSYILFIIYSSIDTTMFKYVIPSLIMQGVLVLSMLGFLYKIVIIDRPKGAEWLIIGLWLLIPTFVFLKTGYSQVLSFSVVIVGCRGIELRKIVEFFFLINVAFLIVLILFSQIGIIQDLIYTRNDVTRHSLGMLYPTNLSAKIFFLVLSFIYLKKNKLTLIHVGVITLIGWLTLKITDGRLDTYLMIFSAFVLYFMQNNKKYRKLSARLGIFVPIIGFVVIYVLSALYTDQSSIFRAINHVLSTRLSLGHEGIERYGAKLLGQFIYSQGYGGITGHDIYKLNIKYFYIDAAYLNILIRFGVLFSLLLFGHSVLRLRQMYQHKRHIFIIIFSLIALNSIVSTFYFFPAHNPFILFLFAKVLTPNQGFVLTKKLQDKEYVKEALKEMFEVVQSIGKLRVKKDILHEISKKLFV
ncbi:MAG: hypothetical protein ACK5MW_04090 [Enterococcus sp.]